MASLRIALTKKFVISTEGRNLLLPFPRKADFSPDEAGFEMTGKKVAAYATSALRRAKNVLFTTA